MAALLLVLAATLCGVNGGVVYDQRQTATGSEGVNVHLQLKDMLVLFVPGGQVDPSSLLSFLSMFRGNYLGPEEHAGVTVPPEYANTGSPAVQEALVASRPELAEVETNSTEAKPATTTSSEAKVPQTSSSNQAIQVKVSPQHTLPTKVADATTTTKPVSSQGLQSSQHTLPTYKPSSTTPTKAPEANPARPVHSQDTKVAEHSSTLRPVSSQGIQVNGQSTQQHNLSTTTVVAPSTEASTTTPLVSLAEEKAAEQSPVSQAIAVFNTRREDLRPQRTKPAFYVRAKAAPAGRS